MAGLGGMMQGSLPIFYGKVFDDWHIKMQAIFGFQDVAEIVKEGVAELNSKATEEDRKNHRAQLKLDSKAATAKEAWEILVKTYGERDKNKKVRLQTLWRQFEFLTMDEKCRGQDLKDSAPRFDHMVVAIEETRALETMEIEELQHSLESHEYIMNERRICQEQVLEACSSYKGKGKMFKKSGKSNTQHKDSQEQKNEGVTEFGRRKSQKAMANSDGEKEWKFNKTKVRCFNCQKFGHFAKECWKGDGAKNKPKNQAHLTQTARLTLKR
ncbi:uncharacterized protein LOC113851048 [Abrus precatorius]|uniref:Uncharacterized protein LOC113851048 n=1 Tax=Abrus precatorius TaxID=3816 RepID=A0A8B8K2U0_ABRPR|nr:uncharacterized protein LOC113851048 [Abrus precatorius]